MTPSERQLLFDLDRRVRAAEGLTVAPPLALARTAGVPMIYLGAAKAAAAAATPGFYARITGNAGKRYSFVQVAVRAENPPGTVTDDVIDVPGGVAGSTTAGWAYDIGGGAVALHTPAPALVVLMTPNPLAAGTYLFGPVTVC